MNAGVSSEKEKVKESQSRRVTPSLDTPSGVGSEASQLHTLGSRLKRGSIYHPFEFAAKTIQALCRYHAL